MPILITILVIAAGLLLLRAAFRRLTTDINLETPARPKPTFVPPPEKTDEQLVADYHALMRELPAALLKTAGQTPTKSDLSKLQRLSRLVSLPLIQPILDSSSALDLFEAGLAQVEAVYGPGNNTGKTRLDAFTKAAKKLRPNKIEPTSGEMAAAQEKPKPADKAIAASRPKAAKKATAVAKPRTARFSMPFDVDAFAAAFPKGWTLVNRMGDEGTLLEGPNGATIGVAPHQLAPSIDLYEALGRLVEQLDDHSGLEAFTTSIKTRGWTVEGEYDDAPTYIVELYGPQLMSVRFAYRANWLDQKVKAALQKAAIGLSWLNAPADAADDPKVASLKDLRRQIQTVLKGDKELRDEILASYEDDENLYLRLIELEAISIQGLQGYSLARSMIRYALPRVTADIDDLVKLRFWCGPHYLNDPGLVVAISAAAGEAASSTNDFLTLADAMASDGDRERAAQLFQQAVAAAQSTEDHLRLTTNDISPLKPRALRSIIDKAIAAASDVGDLRRVLACDAATADLVKPVIKRMRSAVADKDFFATAWNPLEVLQAAFEKGFIDQSTVEKELLALIKLSPVLGDAIEAEGARTEGQLSDDAEYWVEGMGGAQGRDVKPMHLLSMAQSAQGQEWQALGERLLAMAKKAASTPERKYAVYRFMLDELDDEARAKAYRKTNAKVLKPLLDQRDAADQEAQLIDTICQCALLVAVGDGEISDEESAELENVRAIVEMIYRNRSAISILEQTSDIEKAKAARLSTALIHNMALFQPAYRSALEEDLSEISSRADLDALLRQYAARIKDPFGRRLAAWAATCGRNRPRWGCNPRATATRSICCCGTRSTSPWCLSARPRTKARGAIALPGCPPCCWRRCRTFRRAPTNPTGC